MDASGIFLQKVETCELLIKQPHDSPGPVTATEPLVLYDRAFNLTGTQSGEARTAFSSSIRIHAAQKGQDWICCFSGLDFPGNGNAWINTTDYSR